MITIEVHHADYAPWETDGNGDVIADERERIREWTDTHTFDNARECADWLDREGFGVPSKDPGPYDHRTWLTENDPYEHPYTGVLTERSAHTFAGGAHPRVWAAIVATVSRRWTRYAGPYYQEFSHAR